MKSSILIAYILLSDSCRFLLAPTICLIVGVEEDGFLYSTQPANEVGEYTVLK